MSVLEKLEKLDKLATQGPWSLERVQAEAARLREALEWYANEDKVSVEDGILDNVNQRPANRALGRKE